MAVCLSVNVKKCDVCFDNMFCSGLNVVEITQRQADSIIPFSKPDDPNFIPLPKARALVLTAVLFYVHWR